MHRLLTLFSIILVSCIEAKHDPKPVLPEQEKVIRKTSSEELHSLHYALQLMSLLGGNLLLLEDQTVDDPDKNPEFGFSTASRIFERYGGGEVSIDKNRFRHTMDSHVLFQGRKPRILVEGFILDENGIDKAQITSISLELERNDQREFLAIWREVEQGGKLQLEMDLARLSYAAGILNGEIDEVLSASGKLAFVLDDTNLLIDGRNLVFDGRDLLFQVQSIEAVFNLSRVTVESGDLAGQVVAKESSSVLGDLVAIFEDSINVSLESSL